MPAGRVDHHPLAVGRDQHAVDDAGWHPDVLNERRHPYVAQGRVTLHNEARRAVPGLRMVAVAGPRIDPGQLPAHPDVELRAYVHDLYRHLAVCDLAVVQGGLTTTMELVANNTPFLYFPLGHHFEQRFHVPHRLARYGAGRRSSARPTRYLLPSSVVSAP